MAVQLHAKLKCPESGQFEAQARREVSQSIKPQPNRQEALIFFVGTDSGLMLVQYLRRINTDSNYRILSEEAVGGIVDAESEYLDT